MEEVTAGVHWDGQDPGGGTGYPRESGEWLVACRCMDATGRRDLAGVRGWPEPDHGHWSTSPGQKAGPQPRCREVGCPQVIFGGS